MKQSNLTPKEIKNLRISNGLKQRECAEIVGVGIRQWQKYEQGYPCKEIYIQLLTMAINSNELITN
jgi:transcriptional regulator with XRE-family HTH domain